MGIKTGIFYSKQQIIDLLIWQFEDSELVINKDLFIQLIKEVNNIIPGTQINYSVIEFDGELGEYCLVYRGE